MYENRVDPFGTLHATPERGLVYGNRGCLHDGEGRIRRAYAGRRWISCRLEFRGWQRCPMQQPGRFTELFFLDEATAFAAGHRPCALCRDSDYRQFKKLWAEYHPDRGADAIDTRLHGERLDESGGRRTHQAVDTTLPDGVYVVIDRQAWLVHGAQLRCWHPGGYQTARARRPAAKLTVLTPPTVVEILRSGWLGVVPLIHPSAQ